MLISSCQAPHGGAPYFVHLGCSTATYLLSPPSSQSPSSPETCFCRTLSHSNIHLQYSQLITWALNTYRHLLVTCSSSLLLLQLHQYIPNQEIRKIIFPYHLVLFNFTPMPCRRILPLYYFSAETGSATICTVDIKICMYSGVRVTINPERGESVRVERCSHDMVINDGFAGT